jgi:hypothetical protein
LAGADLTNADLTEAELQGADLRGATVDKALFSRAGLFHTDLRGVDLRHADLSNVDTRYTCFDETTQWADGKAPNAAICDADRTPQPLAGAQYAVSASLLDEIKTTGKTQLYSRSLQLNDGRFVLSVYFDNRGIAPLQGVGILVVVPPELSIVSGSVSLRNSNNPDGYSVEPSAVQQGQVHIGIGDYDRGSDAYVEMEIGSSPAACGKRFDITAYATPARFGSVADTVSVNVGC